jgi:hypothetical protein
MSLGTVVFGYISIFIRDVIFATFGDRDWPGSNRSPVIRVGDWTSFVRERDLNALMGISISFFA